jgi:hypothetical protein
MLKTVEAFDRIGEENAFAVLARATKLMSEGRDIVNLGIGQPDFPTPGHIVEAAIKALKDGHHGYTPATGILPLREAVELAGRTRLRPILMTSIATALGLVPMSLGIGEGSELQVPLARVVIGGLTTSLLITLVLVPTVYTIFEEGIPGFRRKAKAAETLS